MNKKIEFSIRNIVIVGIIFSLLSGSSAYILTSYALAENEYAIYGSSVGYQDNSSLGATNVQAALDQTCTKFGDQLTNLKKEVINEMYPKGSIYITTELTKASDVAGKLGGTWEAYGKSDTYLRLGGNGSGGTNTVKLASNQIPTLKTDYGGGAHKHDYKHYNLDKFAVATGTPQTTYCTTSEKGSWTIDSSGAHQHTITNSSQQSVSITPKYVQVYAWKRIA